jgi:hypothetical protein
VPKSSIVDVDPHVADGAQLADVPFDVLHQQALGDFEIRMPALLLNVPSPCGQNSARLWRGGLPRVHASTP